MSAGKPCTNYRYNSNGDCVGMCGEKAIAIYSKENPRTGPSEPTVLTFPRCRTHDTPSIKDMAESQGYERTPVE